MGRPHLEPAHRTVRQHFGLVIMPRNKKAAFLRALDALLPEGEEQHEVVGETRRHVGGSRCLLWGCSSAGKAKSQAVAPERGKKLGHLGASLHYMDGSDLIVTVRPKSHHMYMYGNVGGLHWAGPTGKMSTPGLRN